MPICTREGFYNASSKSNEYFQDHEEVFYCEVTKEIFKDYEDYFRHVMAINSTVWQCEVTGKENLTYAEALKSERRSRKKLEMFKDSLRAPVMLVIEQAKQSSLKILSAVTCRFLRRRYFKNEEVQVTTQKSSANNHFLVTDIISPDTQPPSNGVYEDTEKLLYKLKSLDTKSEIVLPYEKVRRQRFEFTLENLQMFIKNNVIRVDGILKPKPDAYKNYVTDRKIMFENIFIGKMPHFTPAKIRKPTEDANGKKQLTLNQYLAKSSKEAIGNGNSGNRDAKEKNALKTAKSLKEDMERLRLQRQEQLLQQERLKAEKRAKLMERIECQCTALLTKTDDLERKDQRLLPTYTPVQTYMPIKLIGDAFMLREFFHSYASILSSIEVFKDRLSFYEVSRALSAREVAGPLSDIILVLLGTIFDLQHEEEEECTVSYVRHVQSQEPYRTMSFAAQAHHYAKRHFSFKLNQLPLDALTVSEVLRLHILSSGATVENKVAEKWRIMYRNGYSSSEDPGLELRLKYPYILRALKMYTIYQLPFHDILRILRCLMDQILTYSGPINLIEERCEQMHNIRQVLKNAQIMENQRLAKVQTMRRSMINEFNQQCMDDEVKKDGEKRKMLEEKHNKALDQLLRQSEKQHKKYEQQVHNLKEDLFGLLLYLGMDRAYRKYYVLESMPGLFVEHPPDCMDYCLETPPKNEIIHKDLTAHNSDLPKSRKDLRAYLLRMYNKQEKIGAVEAGNTGIGVVNSQHQQQQREDKENQLNRQVNGLSNAPNDHSADAIKSEMDQTVHSPLPPTQYQLFMCTGDSRNCLVHSDGRNPDRMRWSFLYKKDDLDALLDSLNPLGFRESELREQLITLKSLLQDHIKKCPIDMLSVQPTQMSKFRNSMMAETNRKYNNSNFDFPMENTDLNEAMYGALVKRILQFERDIYTGDLGRLKVKDMEKWRTDLHSGHYDPQAKLQWGPPKQNNMVIMGADAALAADQLKIEESDTRERVDESKSEAEEEGAHDDGGQYAMKPYSDPGEYLGETLEIDSEDSADDEISLHDSTSLRSYVKQLASALLQVEQAIERRFLKEPFGPPSKLKSKDIYERNKQWAKNRLRQWEVSLMESTSYSQVFLHLNILHDCILWARSTNKSTCMICQRGSDPDKMLLCDECNGGTHMFCMKPKMKSVPEGNWYCKRCVARLGLKNENDKKDKTSSTRRKRAFIVDDVTSDTSSINSQSRENNKSQIAGEHSKGKGLQPIEIENIIQEECEEEFDNDNEDANSEENGDEQENVDDCDSIDSVSIVPGDIEESDTMKGTNDIHDDHDDDDDDDVDVDANDSGNSTNANEDESICNVCSYEGSELSCTQCKNAYHLECINLKRPPRYNFICSKCKHNENSRKRKSKNNCSSSESEYNEDESSYKRSRYDKHLKQKSQNNGNAHHDSVKTSTCNRRSFRRAGDNLPLNNSALYELLEKVMKSEHAWPFLRPVSQAEVPDYYDIIKNPMDFAKVKSKLNMGSYQINEEVMKDIELIFNNCDEYNVKGNEIYQAGAALERLVMGFCKELNLPFKPSDMNDED